MLVNVNGIYSVHVCEQARWARSAGNSAVENVCIIIANSCLKDCNALRHTVKVRSHRHWHKSQKWYDCKQLSEGLETGFWWCTWCHSGLTVEPLCSAIDEGQPWIILSDLDLYCEKGLTTKYRNMIICLHACKLFHLISITWKYCALDQEA